MKYDYVPYTQADNLSADAMRWVPDLAEKVITSYNLLPKIEHAPQLAETHDWRYLDEDEEFYLTDEEDWQHGHI